MNYGSWLGSIPVQCFSVIDNCWWKKFYYYHCYFNSVKLAPRSSFLKKSDEPRIEAFETKELRPVLRVSWTARKTNVWIMEKAGVTRTLLASRKTMKLRYFGLSMWHKCIEKDIIQGTALLANRRPKTTWLDKDSIIQWTDMDLERVLRATDNRSPWRRMIYGVQSTVGSRMTEVKSSQTLCKCS